MEDFRRQFTLEAAVKLEEISKKLRRAELPAEAFKRETFRTLHTVKGTAQTFGFASASALAHALENLLAEGKIFDKLFAEGVELLKESLGKEDFQIPQSFLEKADVQNSGDLKTSRDANSSAKIPDDFSSQLSGQEKTALRAALENGKRLFCLEIGFDLNDFAEGLINFRETLDAAGEIVATLPSAKFNGDGKIGFRILYASSAKTAAAETTARAAGAEIIYRSDENAAPNNLQNAAAYAVRAGRQIAEKSGKRIGFQVAADETRIAADKLKIVFDVLLHLVRNAVDHAVEREGNIKINLKTEDENLRLTVSDDGDGINLAAVKAKAIQKNLLSAAAALSERETIDLIFLPEFSTKIDITEISGRGIGLDAVKALIVENGGTISVESARGKGTTFEITLPLGQNKSAPI